MSCSAARVKVALLNTRLLLYLDIKYVESPVTALLEAARIAVIGSGNKQSSGASDLPFIVISVASSSTNQVYKR